MNRDDQHDTDRRDAGRGDAEALGLECARAIEQLPLFVGGDLAARDEAQVREHLGGCAPCAERAERMRGAFDAYFATQHREAADALEEESLWPALRARIAAGDAGRAGGESGFQAGDSAGSPSAEHGAGHGSGSVSEEERRAEDDLAWEIAGAGTITPMAVRGPRALRLLAGGIGLAAGVVLTAMVLWKEPRWNGAASNGSAADGAVVAVPVGSGGSDGSGGATDGGAAADGSLTADALADAGAIEPAATDPSATAPGTGLEGVAAPTGGLTPIAPQDDAQRLLHGGGTVDELRWQLSPSGGAGHSLAGSNGWR